MRDAHRLVIESDARATQESGTHAVSLVNVVTYGGQAENMSMAQISIYYISVWPIKKATMFIERVYKFQN